MFDGGQQQGQRDDHDTAEPPPGGLSDRPADPAAVVRHWAQRSATSKSPTFYCQTHMQQKTVCTSQYLLKIQSNKYFV